MNNPKVSIVTMIYNNEQFVKTAVASILEQDYPHIEVIIRDDGSKCFHPEMIRSLFTGSENRLEGIIIEQSPQNGGTVNNFNEAVKLSSGDIIIPLSCDDSFLHKSTVSDIVKTFQATGCLICTARRKSRQTGLLAPDDKTVDTFRKMDPRERFARLCYSNFISGATIYYSRKILEQLGGFDGRFRLLEDHPFVLKTTLADIDIVFMDQPTILYNEGGISQKQKKSAVHPLLRADFQKVYELMIFPNEHLLPKKMARYLRYRYLREYSSSFSQTLWSTLRFWDVALWLIIWKLTGKTDRFRALMQ